MATLLLRRAMLVRPGSTEKHVTAAAPAGERPGGNGHRESMDDGFSRGTQRRTLYGNNVRRLMARLELTQADVVAATGLDERTVRSLMRGDSQPHARTLHKFAAGLGVDVDELFYDSHGAAAAFDRATNPAVAAAIDNDPQLFADWTTADFDELFSRFAVGGELTQEGALSAAKALNERRELLAQAAVVLESRDAELLRELIAMLYRRVTAM